MQGKLLRLLAHAYRRRFVLKPTASTNSVPRHNDKQIHKIRNIEEKNTVSLAVVAIIHTVLVFVS